MKLKNILITMMPLILISCGSATKTINEVSAIVKAYEDVNQFENGRITSEPKKSIKLNDEIDTNLLSSYFPGYKIPSIINDAIRTYNVNKILDTFLFLTITSKIEEYEQTKTIVIEGFLSNKDKAISDVEQFQDFSLESEETILPKEQTCTLTQLETLIPELVIPPIKYNADRYFYIKHHYEAKKIKLKILSIVNGEVAEKEIVISGFIIE